MVESIRTKTRLQSLEDLVQLHQQVREKLADLKERFPIQVGAAKATRLYLYKTQLYEGSKRCPTRTAYLRILKTNGHSRNLEEQQAFDAALSVLTILETFAKKDNKPDSIRKLVEESGSIL